MVNRLSDPKAILTKLPLGEEELNVPQEYKFELTMESRTCGKGKFKGSIKSGIETTEGTFSLTKVN